jgi:hypothetical protein
MTHKVILGSSLMAALPPLRIFKIHVFEHDLGSIDGSRLPEARRLQDVLGVVLGSFESTVKGGFARGMSVFAEYVR